MMGATASACRRLGNASKIAVTSSRNIGTRWIVRRGRNALRPKKEKKSRNKILKILESMMTVGEKGKQRAFVRKTGKCVLQTIA